MSWRRGLEHQPSRRLQWTQTAGNLGESIFDSEVVPSSLVEIVPILRVANEVEATDLRVAYLRTIDMDLIATRVSASERVRRENLLVPARSLIMDKMQIGGSATRLTVVAMVLALYAKRQREAQ